MAFVLNSETIERGSCQPQLLTFEFMSVNICGTIFDNFGFLPQLDPGCLQGHLIGILNSLKPHKQTTQGQNAPTIIKDKHQTHNKPKEANIHKTFLICKIGIYMQFYNKILTRHVYL